jgi:3',5'-cyclic AMP phosphodiesterase CpdA
LELLPVFGAAILGMQTDCKAHGGRYQQIKDETAGGQSLYDGFAAILSEYKPDFILCTGDLTSTGKPLEFMHCLDKIYSLAREASVPVDNVLYCMGNHDVDRQLVNYSKSTYDGLHRELTDDEIAFLTSYHIEFPEAILRNVQSITHTTNTNPFTRNGPAPLCGVIDREQVTIYMLNSGFFCTSDQAIKRGVITPSQIDWLKCELQKPTDEYKWRVLMLHHHPFGYVNPVRNHDTSILQEGAELQDLCGRYGVDLVVHGHRHHPIAKSRKDDSWSNSVVFISAGSLSVNQGERLAGEIPNTFHLIELGTKPSPIKLITYEYVLSDGWVKVMLNRSMLPLDHEVYLGSEVLDDESAKRLITKFPKNIPITYEAIDHDLRYIPLSHLNKLITDVHGLFYSGTFPGDIRIHSLGKEQDK